MSKRGRNINIDKNRRFTNFRRRYIKFLYFYIIKMTDSTIIEEIKQIIIITIIAFTKKIKIIMYIKFFTLQRNNFNSNQQGRKRFQNFKRKFISKESLDRELDGYWRKSEIACNKNKFIIF